MMVDAFQVEKCKSYSVKKKFGLCDEPHPAHNPAYIDETNGARWIAVVENENGFLTTFMAIDNCIVLKRADGKMDKRCDGMLTYKLTVIFVELKDRGAKGNAWVEDAVPQLKSTITHFENSQMAANFKHKKAYISNREHPKFKTSQKERMEKFFMDTGYILRIEARIKLE